MRLPSFLIIGATKAGTTSLHHYMGQHPDVFMLPQKETNFFAQGSALCLLDRTVTDEEEYKKLFANAGEAKQIGETSPAYLAVPDSPELIRQKIPDVKLIVVLRDPIERAFSHYLMRKRQGKEKRETFEECLEGEDLDPMRSYKSRGFYGEQLERHLKQFSRDQLKVFLYEDFVSDPLRVVQECFVFIGVDPSFEPDMNERYNVNPPAEETLSDEARETLKNLYREDIALTQKLTERDLSGWL